MRMVAAEAGHLHKLDRSILIINLSHLSSNTMRKEDSRNLISRKSVQGKQMDLTCSVELLNLADLFIYRFLQDATEDSIKENVAEARYEVRLIKQMSHADAKFKSFRLSVPASQYQSLRSDDDFWPRGVRVKHFIPPKL